MNIKIAAQVMGLPRWLRPSSACNAKDLGSVPGSERFPGEGKGNPLQYSRPENSTDRGAWQATVHGVTEWGTTKQLTHTHTPTHTHTHMQGLGRNEWILKVIGEKLTDIRK